MRCPSGARAVPERCPSGARAVPERCPSGARAVPERCPSGARAVPERCPRWHPRWHPKECPGSFGDVISQLKVIISKRSTDGSSVQPKKCPVISC